jgi:murein L,D-transpeptidase YcbB/YkuD
MIARTVFRLGLAVCFAGVSHLAMAQAVGTPEAQAAAAMNAAPGAKPQSNAPEQKPAQASAKPAAATAAVAANAAQAPRAAEAAAKPAPAQAVALDAMPSPATPDPLTPPEPSGPAPKAPGAEAKPANTAQAPQAELNPLATQILAHVAKAGGRSDARDDVAGATAYYTDNKGEAIWVSKEGFNHKAQKAIHEIRNANEWGLDASAFQLPSNPGASASLEVRAEAEIKLSLAVLKYARHARGGRFDPSALSPIIDRRPHIYDPKSVLEGISEADSADAYLRGLHPKHEQFKRLRQAYLALGKSPGGEGSSENGSSGEGSSGEGSSQNEEAAGSIFSNESHGGGSLDQKRLRILVNMERWRWMPENLGEFYVWDSVTEQIARVYDHGKMVLQEKIVVGKPGTPTPTFSAPMQFITFNPEWGVPEGIKVNEIAPKLKSSGGGGGAFLLFGGSSGGGGSSDILQRMGGLHVTLNGKPVDPDSVDWSRVDIRRYTFTQGAGGKNVLGQVKFRFPNKHDVYMHDTVDRHLFGNGQRAFSHGCMRTQNPLQFAEVLLAHDRGTNAAQIRDMVASGQTNEIALRNSIPVHIAYFTAEVDEKGQVRYFHDLYGLDNRVGSALRGQPVQVASEPAPPSAPTSAEEQDSEEPASWAHPRPHNNRHQPAASAERRPWNPFMDWN